MGYLTVMNANPLSEKELLRWYWMWTYLRLPKAGIAVSLASEDAARERLCMVRWPDGIVCPGCGDQRIGQKTARDLFKCGSCGHHVSATAGTALHSTNLPVLLWLLAAEEYVIRQATGKITMLTNARFGVFLGTRSNDTVVRVKKKLKADLEPGGEGLLLACASIADRTDMPRRNPIRDDYDDLVSAIGERNISAFRR